MYSTHSCTTAQLQGYRTTRSS
eukprot:COSAG01_NODE_66592_length_269_cov_1.441176_1_plen_21_part_01